MANGRIVQVIKDLHERCDSTLKFPGLLQVRILSDIWLYHLVFVPLTSSLSIASSTLVPRSTWSFRLPSTEPSGSAWTPFAAPGCLLPLSLIFFSFFFVSGGG